MHPSSPQSTPLWSVAGWKRHVAALLIIAGAVVVRGILEPLLGANLPFVTLFAGVALTARYCRALPSAISAVAGFLATHYFFSEPRGAILIDPHLVAGFAGYAFSVGIIIATGEALHRAREKLEVEVAQGHERVKQLHAQGQELAEREARLREAKENAEKASRAKDEFIAQLSHELRTPLTPVLMTASAFKEDPALSGDVREAFEMIARNVALEARLIDDLLDLTRIVRGKVQVRAEACDVHHVIGLAVDMIRSAALDKRITFVVEHGAQETQMKGDSTRLQQVFWNLLSNAVKFSGPPGRVRIATRNPSPDVVAVEVSDDGIGFEPETADILFEPFHQATKASGEGLGLGLPIARAIVNLHGGRIEARSEGAGCGATFRVELPLRKKETNCEDASADATGA
jgi:signal transduction histidine kinase